MIANARRKLRSVLALWAMAFFRFGAADAAAATLPPARDAEIERSHRLRSWKIVLRA